MQISVKVGDVLDEAADALICTANPWLNMSGGVNGALLLRGGHSVQEELRAYLRGLGRPAVEPGSVIVTGPGPLHVKYILHAVAIDPFYDSSVKLVERTLDSAFSEAQRLRAESIVLPMLGTGYGPLTPEQFAAALLPLIQRDWSPVVRVTLVVRRSDDLQTLQESLTF
jgi:O-acetyl-ADP-ribose deacetylase (regulator of RNase III)